MTLVLVGFLVVVCVAGGYVVGYRDGRRHGARSVLDFMGYTGDDS